jgi:hypothetical protein
MDTQKMIDIFVIARATSEAGLLAMKEITTDPIEREELDILIAESNDMFDMKLEMLNMRASL